MQIGQKYTYLTGRQNLSVPISIGQGGMEIIKKGEVVVKFVHVFLQWGRGNIIIPEICMKLLLQFEKTGLERWTLSFYTCSLSY